MSQPTNRPGRNAPIFDSAVPPADRDQTHALVIGVGTYPYLPGGSGHRRDSRVPTWGMKQLKSPVVSARAFADWLCLGYQNSSAPLGSVNLLLSPANPFAATGRTPLPVDPPEMAKVQAAYDAWYARCDARPGNIALFYFCGHGVAQGFNSLLLCADYGADPVRPFTTGLIDLQGTFVGTATCRAKTLCFFIDACRTGQDVNAKGVALRDYLKEPFGDRDYRLIRSAAYDQSAYGQSNLVSVFTDVLLDCLRDGLGVNRRREDDACWVITTESLQENLVRLLGAPVGPAQGPAVRHVLPALAQLADRPARARSGPDHVDGHVLSQGGRLPGHPDPDAPGRGAREPPRGRRVGVRYARRPVRRVGPVLETVPGHPHAGASGLAPALGAFPPREADRHGDARDDNCPVCPRATGPRRGRRLTAEQP